MEWDGDRNNAMYAPIVLNATAANRARIAPTLQLRNPHLGRLDPFFQPRLWNLMLQCSQYVSLIDQVKKGGYVSSYAATWTSNGELLFLYQTFIYWFLCFFGARSTVDSVSNPVLVR